MPEQLSLLDLPPQFDDHSPTPIGKESPNSHGSPKSLPEQPKSLPVESFTGCQIPKDARFAVGGVVIVHRLYPDNDRECDTDFYWAGSVIGYNRVGYVLVNTGVPGNPYPCPEERLTKYDGVVSLWRLGQATACDRPDCTPSQSATPFTCQQCEARSQPHWWYVGEMSTEPYGPRWPDAMWFPTHYTPNERRFEE